MFQALKAILEYHPTSRRSTSIETDHDAELTPEELLFKEYKWLLKEVPSLEHFSSFVPALVLTMRQVCAG